MPLKVLKGRADFLLLTRQANLLHVTRRACAVNDSLDAPDVRVGQRGDK